MGNAPHKELADYPDTPSQTSLAKLRHHAYSYSYCTYS